MNNELIMYGLLGSGLIVWIASYVYQILYERHRKRVIDQQIRDNVVPVDYSAVIREVATDRNNEVLHQGILSPEQEEKAVNLERLRWHVAAIRVLGYDAAKRAEERGELFAFAIETNNPYEKGSGEAKQWARGFCQGFGKGGHPPAGWMERA